MKSTIRKEILALRREMTQDEIETASAKIVSQLMALSIVDHPQVIMCYMDFRNEVQTNALIEYLLSLDKTIVLPKVNPQTNYLDLFQFEGFKDLNLSKMGILEPADNLPRILPTDIDLILVPGVAFDLKGYRMGYGAGYYDKLLPHIRPDCEVIGLAFDLQIVETLPVESHDQPMDSILTETRWIHPNALTAT